MIGGLMVLVTDVWPRRRLVRPFLGVGVLGGYTTFSTAMLDVTVAAPVSPGTALLYLVATPVACLLAVAAGTSITRRLVRRGPGQAATS